VSRPIDVCDVSCGSGCVGIFSRARVLLGKRADATVVIDKVGRGKNRNDVIHVRAGEDRRILNVIDN
jgi:hypothetical protein